MSPNGLRLFSQHPKALGGVVGFIFLPVHLLVPMDQSVGLAALLLCLIAGVYIGFAVLKGDSPTFLFELTGALIFAFTAWFAMYYEPWVIPALYVLHAAWDWLHHLRNLNHLLPSWYIPFCAVVDLLAAAGISIAWLAK